MLLHYSYALGSHTLGSHSSFGRHYQGIKRHVHDLLVPAYTSFFPLTLLRDQERPVFNLGCCIHFSNSVGERSVHNLWWLHLLLHSTSSSKWLLWLWREACAISGPQQLAHVAPTPLGHGVDSAPISNNQHLEDEFDAEDICTLTWYRFFDSSVWRWHMDWATIYPQVQRSS